LAPFKSPFAELLRGAIVHLAFFEPSTRTRVSFETASLLLGAQVINFGGDSTSVVKGESLEDTAATLGAMNPSVFIARHPHTGAAAKLAAYLECPVVNAGDGRGHHPTQALLDAATVNLYKPIWKESRHVAVNPGRFTRIFNTHRGAKTIGRQAGKQQAFSPLKILICGDVKNSRVARSNAEIWTRLGHDVTLAGPPQLLPCGSPYPGVKLSEVFDEHLESADVVMMLRIQKERIAGGAAGLRDFRSAYGLTRGRLTRLKKDALILHPGPCNRGIEIDCSVFEDGRCVIRGQVRMGVAVRMAVLAMLLGKLE